MAFLPSSLIGRRMLSRSLIWSRSFVHTHRMSTTINPQIQNPSPHPCLMLPPSFHDDTSSIDYNLYSLTEKRVVTRPQVEGGLRDLIPKPIHDLRICGSSHGWISLFNPHTLDLFIYNPITLRHIKIPLIRNLPSYPKDNIKSVKKLVLSYSPDEKSCRAAMIYNCQDGVAFCCPSHNNEWTPIENKLLMYDEIKGNPVGDCYVDFVYSCRQNLFFDMNTYYELETWDVSDPSYPRLIKMIKTDDDKYFDNSMHTSYSDFLSEQAQENYLVVADEFFSDDEDDVLLVTRYVSNNVAPDGSCVKYDISSDFYPPHMTIDFDVDVYDQEKDEIHTGLPSLGDMALFLGSFSESIALPATLFPHHLESNSIYFTDQYMECREYFGTTELFGGHDIGIFNFENKNVSPCYYPCDLPYLKRIEPSPIWFFSK